MLMDAWIHEYQGNAFDENGNWALQGKINEVLPAKMLPIHFLQKRRLRAQAEMTFILIGCKKNEW
jgi:1,6-anhydro-N-acetylmuramate kinase